MTSAFVQFTFVELSFVPLFNVKVILCHGICKFHLKQQEKKIVESANSIDPDEPAHNEQPHLDLQCLPSTF